MRNFILTALTVMSFTCAAHAEKMLTLNFNNLTLTSREDGAAMVDLTNEIKKQSPQISLSGQRIKSVVVTGQPSFLGATVVLLVSGQAVDSQTSEETQTQDLTLSTQLPNTPTPWILGVRGQMTLQQVKVTIDDQLSSTPPKTLGRGDSTPSTSANNTDLAVGEKIIAVSSTTGVIDYANFAGSDGNGFYAIKYNGQIYNGWSRSQLAKVSGCSGEYCVGQSAAYNGESVRVIGILPGGAFVVENSASQARSEVDVSELSSAVSQPAPRARLAAGDQALYVDNGNRVARVTVKQVRRDGSVDMNYGGTVYNIANPTQIASVRGCVSAGFCVGDHVKALSANGRRYLTTIQGIQSDALVVLSFDGTSGMMGNWPVSTLER